MTCIYRIQRLTYVEGQGKPVSDWLVVERGGVCAGDPEWLTVREKADQFRSFEAVIALRIALKAANPESEFYIEPERLPEFSR